MDDFNLTSLNDSRNEYCSLFINKVTPFIVQGITAIFRDAVDLCAENDEDEKYLMTFQNCLSRVTKWNQELINEETERIVEGSNCNYLEDLLTCIHITQLKILTCVRVSHKPKKIDVKIPNLSEFIHKVYIEVARRIYKNVFLFELNVLPLTKQKNMRELELIVRNSILDVVRNSMPIEEILRAYVDETTQEDICETREEIKEVVEEVPIEEVPIEDASVDQISNESSQLPVSGVTPIASANNNGTDNNIVLNVDNIDEYNNSVYNNVNAPTNTPINTPINTPTNIVASIEQDVKREIESLQGLSFSNNDTQKVYDTEETPINVTNQEEKVINAPKDIETLETLSNIRNEQRKLEEEEEDDDEFGLPLRIHNDSTVNLGSLDIHNLDSNKVVLNEDPLLGEITTLA